MGSTRGSGGLRATWERRRQAAELAAFVTRLPAQSSCKPAFFVAQLQPVVAALQQACALDNDNSPSSAEGPANSDTSACTTPAASSEQQALLATAASHLLRLQGIDQHAEANACLLLFLLLGMVAGDGNRQAGLASSGEDDPEEEHAGLAFLQLCSAVGWQALLPEALPLLKRQQQLWLASSMVTAATAVGNSDAVAATAQQCLLQQLVAWLATRLQRLLHARTGRVDTSLDQKEVSAVAELLQQLLLVCPAALAAPQATDAVHQLQATVDTCMAGLMQAMQLSDERRQRQQAMFQQLCQLRARLMLALATVGGSTSGSNSEGHGGQPCSALQHGDPGFAADTWQQVLRMPAAPGAGQLTASRASLCPSRHQFLAACVAARCILQARSSTCSTGMSSSDGSGGSRVAPDPYGRAAECPALPGVRLELPLLPRPQTPPQTCEKPGGSIGLGLALEAERAAVDLAKDPGCLDAPQLVFAALQLAAELDSAADSGFWPALLELAADAASDVTQRSHQRQLLLVTLHGRQPWQVQLRQALAADAELQQRCRRQLVTVANRLAADLGGGSAAAVVHGEERQRRTRAAVVALLPHALLSPRAVLERLVREAVVQAGEQVELLLDVLREMQPLAAYCDQNHPGSMQELQRQQQPLLLQLLAELLLPVGGSQAAAVLDTPGSQQAFLQLVGGLCGMARSKGKPGTAAAAAAVQGGARNTSAVLAPSSVLQHVVAPALQRAQQQGGAATADLPLPLQLADSLLDEGTGGTLQQELAQLQPLLFSLLSLESRRVDRSAALLAAGAGAWEVLELAARLLQRAGVQPSSDAASYFTRQLPAPPAQHSRRQPAQQLQQFRQDMLRVLAALLPCCTASEAGEVLSRALPAAIQAALMPQAVLQGASGCRTVLPGAHAAAVDAACRAARALALRPSQAPIAGEQPGAAAGPPSVLRQVAVERVLQHLVHHSARLAVAACSVDAHAGGTDLSIQRAAEQQAPDQFSLTPAESQALALRCFKELCQLAVAVQPAQYDCATLQTGLLQLAQRLLRSPLPAAGASGRLGAEELEQQLAAAAEALPAGSLREVVRASIQQGARPSDF